MTCCSLPTAPSPTTLALIVSAVLLGMLVVLGAALWRQSRRLASLTHDAAERAHLQERHTELERRTAELETRLRTRNEFLLTLSHEMRTPLNAVIAFSHLLQSRATDNRLTLAQRDWARRIESAGAYLLSLMDDVLETARLDTEGAQPISQPFHLARAAADCAELLSELARHRDVALRLELPPPGTIVSGDARRFKQILINLLSNAIKYNQPGGEVIGRVVSHGPSIDVRVRDNGVGMTREQLAQLFVPFHRLGREHDNRDDGTGLGLVITRQLVEALGGSIQVRSEPGQGSEFAVEIPWVADRR